MTINITKLVAANADRWTKVRVTATGFVQVAKRLVAQKARYLSVEQTTGVPWFIVAVIHEREASQRFDTQLGQGDPLSRVSVHVPKGRGPFSTWEQGAYDALVRCAPYAGRWQDWSPGGALTLLEQYNGLGYAGKGRPSPYVWAGTNQYVSGKYVRDGVYDATAVDKQLGCAGLIIAMQAMDPTIQFGPHAYPATHDATEHPAAPAKAPASPVAPPVTPAAPSGHAAPTPVPQKPSLANTLSIVLNAIRGLFKK